MINKQKLLARVNKYLKDTNLSTSEKFDITEFIEEAYDLGRDVGYDDGFVDGQEND